MDRIDQLRIERAADVERAKALIDLAQREGRDLTAREQASFDTLTAHAERLSEQIDAEVDFLRFGSQRRIGATGVGGERAGEGRTLGGWLAGEFRDLKESSGGGQYLVPDDYLPRVWEFLAAESVGLRSGFTVIDTDRDALHIPQVTADPAGSWLDEAQVITPTDPALAEIIARPSKLGSLTIVSNEIVVDSHPSVLDVTAKSLMRSLALKLDDGFFEGNGTPPEIRGLRATAGIQEVSLGTNGGALVNLDPIADAIGLLEAANARASAIVMAPRTWGALIKVKEATGSVKPLVLQEAVADGVRRSLYGTPVYLTSQLSITETQGTATNATSIYVYQADQIIAVRRQDVRVERDPYRLFDRDQTELRAISRWALAVPNPLAVVRIKGIIP